MKICYFFTIFSRFSSLIKKVWNLMKITNTLLKSWLKNLSNEYIYAEGNLNRSWDIWFQSWLFRNQKRLLFSPKFWLWRQVQENWQVKRGFMVWFFLSWGIDCRIETWKYRFGRITSRNFNHPISHCVLVWSHSILVLVKSAEYTVIKVLNWQKYQDSII